nr:MAG TPA: hypothetical protein [Caudoviricetes sp.]
MDSTVSEYLRCRKAHDMQECMQYVQSWNF